LKPTKDSKDAISVENASQKTGDGFEGTSKDESFSNLKQKTDNAIKKSIEFGVSASQNIDKNIKEGIKKSKESSLFQGIQDKSNKLRTMDDVEKRRHKKNIIRSLIKIRDEFFSLFEKFVGRIRIGTQYGKSSVDLLSEIAKLKELGIISEKEFESKKKEILERI